MKKRLSILSGVIVAFVASIGINATTVPENLYVEPGTNSCDVRWDDDENSAWNLRYRLFTDETGDPVMLHSLTGSAYTGSYADITLPAPWGGVNTRAGQGAIYFRNNYNNSGVYGNITYTIPSGYTNATFTLMITTGSGNYGSGNYTVASTQTAAVGHNFSGGESYSWTVTASSGEQIIITSTDNSYSPDIALIAVYYVPSIEWTYVNNLTKTEYTIEDLEMATEYEVQVQAIGDNGVVSDWTRPDVFMTLDEEPIIPSVHIMGEVGIQEWAYDEGTKMEYDPETETYTATVFIAADKTFGFSTEIDIDGDLGGWNYVNQYRFGPVSNGLFELTEDRLGIQLPLSFDWDYFSDVHVLTAGEYEITVSLEQNYIIIGRISEPPHGYDPGDVNHDHNVSIGDVTALIDMLLGVSEDGCSICADVNGDNNVSIGDVTALIDILLEAN
jgi:hypothetical protein